MKRGYHVLRTDSIELGRFEIFLDTVEEGGREYPYSYIKMKKSVAVLPFFDEKIVLINQYRHSLGLYELEIPGGSMEPGEEPEEAAERELLEETGYSVKRLFFLGSYFPSPGSSDEITYLYGAECSAYKKPVREPLEYIEEILIEKDEMNRLIRTGKFRHGMGLAAWLRYTLSGIPCWVERAGAGSQKSTDGG